MTLDEKSEDYRSYSFWGRQKCSYQVNGKSSNSFLNISLKTTFVVEQKEKSEGHPSRWLAYNSLNCVPTNQ